MGDLVQLSAFRKTPAPIEQKRLGNPRDNWPKTDIEEFLMYQIDFNGCDVVVGIPDLKLFADGTIEADDVDTLDLRAVVHDWLARVERNG